MRLPWLNKQRGLASQKSLTSKSGDGLPKSNEGLKAKRGRRSDPPFFTLAVLAAIVHLEFNRMRAMLVSNDLFHLERDIGIDLAFGEDATFKQKFVVCF